MNHTARGRTPAGSKRGHAPAGSKPGPSPAGSKREPSAVGSRHGPSPAGSKRRGLLSSSALLGTLAVASTLFPAAANAQCAPDPAIAGDKVVCTGADTDGIQTTEPFTTLTVEAGATISTTAQQAVWMSGGFYSFNNFGTITASTDISSGVVQLIEFPNRSTSVGVNAGEISLSTPTGYALRLSGGILRFENREGATIRSNGLGVVLDSNFGGLFANAGLITSASRPAIDIITSFPSGPIQIVNEATGQIISPVATAVSQFGNNIVHVNNSGLIQGRRGVSLSDGSVINAEGALIEGLANYALYSGSVQSGQTVRFTNHGTVRGVGVAVSGYNFQLTNSGTVEGSVTQSLFNTMQNVANSGTIIGDVLLGESYDAFENTGHLTGNLDLGSGSDVFRDFGGTIDGLITLGAGDDFVLLRPDQTSTIAPLVYGGGLDSIGYSVEGVETVTPLRMMGFQGFVVESRYKDSHATIVGDPFDERLSLFGSGKITTTANFINITGDAVRLYSNGRSFIEPATTAFGSGVTFINEGSLASFGGAAIRSVEDLRTGDGSETVINKGRVLGDIFLAGGSDMLVNEGVITGNIHLAGAGIVDDDWIINTGEIDGGITTGRGNDVVLNGGQIWGIIDLGFGDDTYLLDLDYVETSFGGPFFDSPGFDAWGVSTTGTVSATLDVASGFELAAARAHSENAVLEVAAAFEADSLPALRTSGPGKIINRVDLDGFLDNQRDTPAALSISSHTTVENYGLLGGLKAIEASGIGATITNHADLTRRYGSDWGRTGFIHDFGMGTTLTNNGDILDGDYSSAVFIGLSTDHIPVYLSGQSDIPRSTFINNGRITSNGSGVRINSRYGANVVNAGEIDDIEAERSLGGIEITNSESGTLGAISINGSSIPSPSHGSVRITNDGRIEVLSGVAINFRDNKAFAEPGHIFDDYLTNSGTIIGDVLFNAGKDTFTVVDDGSVTGQVDGGADTDTLIFTNLAGLLDVNSFVNFEALDISSVSTSAITSDSGNVSAFDRMIIRSGQTNLSTDITIDTTLEAAAALSGGGILSGDVTAAGRLSSTPGAAAFRVGGDLTLADTAVIDLRVTENATSRLVVDGAATLAGARVDYTVVDRPLLDLDLNASLAFNGQRTGTFSSLDFFNSPTSRTTIGANAGFNGLFDRLAIRQGLILVQSELRGDVYVGVAGVLGGNGTIVGDVTADGVIAPGASIGALTINGDLILGPASTLAIETDANGTDLLTVTGNASLGGALVLLGDTGGTTRKRTFQFLDVGGAASGTFDSIALSSGLSALNTVSIGPDGSVSLVVTPQLALNVALDPAAQGAASYFNALIANDQGSAATDAILTALAPLAASPAALETTLRSLQPETYAASIHAGARQALNVADTIRPRTSASQRGEGFSAWLTASDGSSDVDANPARGLSGHSTDTTSTIGGVEYAGLGYLLGGYGGAIQTDQSLAAQSTSADGVALGAYAALDLGPIRSSLNVGYIDSDATARRSVAALGETVTAEHDLTALTAQADLSTSLALGAFSLTPLVGAVFAHVERGAASEAGGNAALDIEENGEDFLFLDAGATLARSFELGGGVTLSPSIWAGWRHELLAPTVSARGGLRGTPTNGLYTLSAQPDRSRLALRAALDVGFSEMVSASVGYEGEFGDTTDTSAISGTLNLRF